MPKCWKILITVLFRSKCRLQVITKICFNTFKAYTVLIAWSMKFQYTFFWHILFCFCKMHKNVLDKIPTTTIKLVIMLLRAYKRQTHALVCNQPDAGFSTSVHLQFFNLKIFFFFVVSLKSYYLTFKCIQICRHIL